MLDRDKTYLLKELTRTIDESDSTAAFCLCQRWILKDALALLKEQEAVVHCGDCENFCFDNISPNAGRCMLTNMSHSKTWFCTHGKSEEGR